MQLSWDTHFKEIVLVAWQNYRQAEQRLTEVLIAGDERAGSRARFDVLREGGAACFYLHHFMDVVLRARPHWLPDNRSTIIPDRSIPAIAAYACGWSNCGRTRMTRSIPPRGVPRVVPPPLHAGRWGVAGSAFAAAGA